MPDLRNQRDGAEQVAGILYERLVLLREVSGDFGGVLARLARLLRVAAREVVAEKRRERSDAQGEYSGQTSGQRPATRPPRNQPMPAV